MRRLLFSLLVCLAAGLCLGSDCRPTPTTEVVVEIRADAEVREAMHTLRLEIWSATGELGCSESTCWAKRLQDDFEIETLTWPLRFPVLPRIKDASGVFEVIAQARDAADNVLQEQRAVSSFVPGAGATITLTFDRLCAALGSTCSQLGSSCHGPLCSTCRQGMCETAGMWKPTAKGALAQSPFDAGETSGADDDASVADAAASDDASTDTDAQSIGANGCEGDRWDHDGDPSTVCVARTRCAAGEYALPLTAGADRRCAGCAAGSFAAQENAAMCRLWSDCAAGSYVSNVPSVTEDRVCTTCAQGSVTTSANQSACLPEGSCPAGTRQVTPASGSSPPVCANCAVGTYCAGADAPPVDCGAGTWDHDAMPATGCTSHTRCVAGQYMAKAGSASADRSCAMCELGSFSTQENAPSCTAWTPCTTNFRESRAGTGISDRACTALFGGARQLTPPAGLSVVGVSVDGSGNLLLAGSVNGALAGQTAQGSLDVVALKQAYTGAEVWTRQFGTSAWDVPRTLRAEANGTVYVVGETQGLFPGQTNGAGSDGFVRKLDAGGTELWTRQLGTTQSETFGTTVGVDPSGNVYLGGYTYGAFPNSGITPTGMQSPFLRKYGSDGTESWTRQWASDQLRAVTGDSAGNVYVAGRTTGSDLVLRKFNSGGVEVWARQWGSVGTDVANAVVLDGSGNVYVAGTTNDALPDQQHAGGNDAFVSKYSAAGTELWTRQFGTNQNEEGRALALDSAGNVYVAGSSSGPLANPAPAGDNDVMVRKYSPAGAELWTFQLGSSGADSATWISVASGNVWVAGSAGGVLPGANAEGGSYFVMKLLP